MRHNFYLSRVLYIELALAHLTGDWDKGRDASDQGLAVSPHEFRLILGRCLLELELGNFEEGREYLDRIQEELRYVAPGPTYAHAMVAALAPLFNRISGTDAGLDAATEAEQMVLTSLSRTPFLDLWTRVGPSLKAVQQGDSSLASCRNAGYRPELAWTCCDYADLLLQGSQSVRPELVEGPGGSTSSPRAGGEDRAMAMALLDKSLALSSESGMRPLMERVLSRRQILGA